MLFKNSIMIPILGYISKVGFYVLATKLVVSGGMTMWMCSNVDNITSFTNFTTETNNLKFKENDIENYYLKFDDEIKINVASNSNPVLWVTRLKDKIK